MIRSNNLSERIGNLVDGSDAFVVCNGKMGSVHELIQVLQSEYVQSIAKAGQRIRKPIIIADKDGQVVESLRFLMGKDQKFAGSPALEDVFTEAGFEGWEENADRILRLYYLKRQGAELSLEDEVFLAQNNFKYRYEHWIETARVPATICN